MNYQFLIEDARARHEDYLRAAAEWRRVKQYQAVPARRHEQLLTYIADHLIATGLWIKTKLHSQPVAQQSSVR